MTPVTFFRLIVVIVLFVFAAVFIKDRRKIGEKIENMKPREWGIVVVVSIVFCIALGYVGTLFN